MDTANPMNVAVVGAGYVGLVTAACLADLGHTVACVDHDPARVLLLQSGGIPIHEPGLEAIVQRTSQAGRLRFTTRLPPAVAQADVVFIAVGTPPREDGSADLQHVMAVARQLGDCLHGSAVVVNKSTVPVGAGARVEDAIASGQRARGLAGAAAVVSNPEFLREGAAIGDFMDPERIVVGLPDGAGGERARDAMARLYGPFNTPRDRMVWMDRASAELTKYAANAMLATRISFMNEIANLAERVGADVEAVRRGIGSDGRIGPGFLAAGTGYGGSCFPKDTRALLRIAADHGLDMQIVDAAERVNHAQKLLLLRRLHAHFGGDLRGRAVAVWGLSFKPDTDDMREAPSRVVIGALLGAGARITAFDPVATAEARRALASDLGRPVETLEALRFADSPLDALDGAEALLVMTEWSCFRQPDFEAMARRMRQPVVFDGRNLYDPAQMARLGFHYRGVGRRGAPASPPLRRQPPAQPIQAG